MPEYAGPLNNGRTVDRGFGMEIGVLEIQNIGASNLLSYFVALVAVLCLPIEFEGSRFVVVLQDTLVVVVECSSVVAVLLQAADIADTVDTAVACYRYDPAEGCIHNLVLFVSFQSTVLLLLLKLRAVLLNL